METENLTQLSEQELLQKLKKIKNNKIIGATLIGITIGIIIYSVAKNGFGLFILFPLILGYLFFRNSKSNEILEKEIQKELKSRNSK